MAGFFHEPGAAASMRQTTQALAGLSFDEAPAALRRTIYCQPWVHLKGEGGDDLYVTRLGWPFLGDLLPEHWFAGQAYAKHGTRLQDSTGTVYRVPGRCADLVVKFNRIALDPLLHHAEAVGITRQDADGAEFLGPFEELSMVMELRQGWYGPRDLLIPAAWPMAVYSPAKRYPAWRLGRSDSRWQRHVAGLANDQAIEPPERRVSLAEDRDYITIHHWLRGQDANHCVRRGILSPAEAAAEVALARADISRKGFRVLDFKAHHLILRPDAHGRVRRRRDGRLLHAIIDFELLERLPAYCLGLSRGEANNPPPRLA